MRLCLKCQSSVSPINSRFLGSIPATVSQHVLTHSPPTKLVNPINGRLILEPPIHRQLGDDARLPSNAPEHAHYNERRSTDHDDGRASKCDEHVRCHDPSIGGGSQIHEVADSEGITACQYAASRNYNAYQHECYRPASSRPHH